MLAVYWIPLLEMDSVNRVQNLDKTVYISHSANTLGKSMNQIILPPAMVKIVGHSRLFNFDMATDLGNGKLWIQTC